MRFIHPAALVGLFLNLALGLMFFSVMASVDLSALSDQDQDTLEAVLEVLETVKTFYFVLLGLQALALGLIASRIRFGIHLALVAAFFMLPGSLVYGIGAMFSQDRVKYADVAIAPAKYTGAHYIFRAYATKKMYLFTGISTAFFLFMVMAGWGDVSLIFFGFALAGLYFAVRSAKHHALTLHDDYFTLSPGIFSRRLLVPYSSVGLATLFDDETIRFSFPLGSCPAILMWSLRTVDPKERRFALEELGAALAAHGVQLQ